MAVELQICHHDLQNARLRVSESDRMAEDAAATVKSLAALQQANENLQDSSARRIGSNGLFTVRFEFGSTRFDIPPDAATMLLHEAKGAPLVLLRGRTDGLSDAPVESRFARDRAAAVRDYLVAAGVDASRIRTTYQPSGDHVANNADPGGRALNRRVEIEIYRALPVALDSATGR